MAAICENPRADAVVRSTINLAQHLDLSVVAEGIETQEVLDHVTELGCDRAQGYLMARPLPYSELAARVAELNGELAQNTPPLEINARRTTPAARTT